jgi:hypothetical protein
MADNQTSLQMAQMQSVNLWQELDDHHNMMNEFEIEPDYFIDTAPDAVFVPNPTGDHKAT